MRFNVGDTVTIPETDVPRSPLRDIPFFTPEASQIRQVLLTESTDEFGRILPLLGVVSDGKAIQKRFEDNATEIVVVNSTEVWEIINISPDAHPIHLHLIYFEILGREGWDEVSMLPIPGTETPPSQNELGPKDTVVVYPSTVVRIRGTFDLIGSYVWHCHILSHEDHDMMRPLEVIEQTQPSNSANSLPSYVTPVIVVGFIVSFAGGLLLCQGYNYYTTRRDRGSQPSNGSDPKPSYQDLDIENGNARRG